MGIPRQTIKGVVVFADIGDRDLLNREMLRLAVPLGFDVVGIAFFPFDQRMGLGRV